MVGMPIVETITRRLRQVYEVGKPKNGKTAADHLQPPNGSDVSRNVEQKRIFDLIASLLYFEKSESEALKKVAAYHQYYAVNKAVESTVNASGTNGDRRAV